MALPTYSTGTASVTAGGTVVTNSGGLWSGINVKQGDFISIAGYAPVLITEVTDTAHLKIGPWGEGSLTAAPYIIYQNYVGRVVGVAAAEDIGDMLDRLRDQAPIYNVPAGDDAPDPSYGTDGNFAYQVETNAWWQKASGVWVPLVGPPVAGTAGSTPPADSLVYGRKNVGGTTTWQRAVAVAGDTMTGPLVVPAPTAALHAATKQYVDAIVLTPPVNMAALSYTGLQVNGGFEVNQQALGGIANGNVCDNWAFAVGGSAVCVANIYSGGWAGALGFSKHFGMTVSTAEPSLGAGSYAILYQRIEGYRLARLGWGTAGALPVTIGFWSCHHRAGLYTVALRGFSSGLAYVATYTQNISDAPEYKAITIPGATTGTWLSDNGTGVEVAFTFACGTTYTTAAGAWTGGNFIAATGQVNGLASTSDVFRLAGVVVLPGSDAPSSSQSQLLMRPYGDELRTCMRYFESVPLDGSGAPAAFGQVIDPDEFDVMLHYKVLKRAVPTAVTVSAPGHFSVNGTTGYVYFNCTSLAASYVGTSAARLVGAIGSASLAAGNATYLLRDGTDPAYIWIDARL